HLQDAILRISDLAYLPRQHRFVVMLNRFCWEGCPEGSLGERVLTGLHFDGMLKVQSQNVRQDDPEAVAELLAIDFAPSGDGAGAVDFILSGGGRIRLEVECIEASLRDIA